jgi:CubicO group peptidase (beta-lactamase class C family)
MKTLGLVLAGAILAGIQPAATAADPPNDVFPGKQWQTCSPAAAGLSGEKLAALTNLVGGRGCVVRHGRLAFTWGDPSKSSDVASAFKPILSTLLWVAIQEHRLSGPDGLVADFEPRLKTLNDGKDAAITWRHLASQTSGYGLAEKAGEAYSYNDFALALYYDTLTERVFGTNGTEVLRTRLAEPLQFEDRYTFNAFGPNNRPGRLALSCRDFARFGLLVLRQGRWRDRQLIPASAFVAMINSLVPPGFPLTSGKEAGMLPGQRSIGGARNITPVGPGYYSFNWWLNRTNAAGQRLFVDAPPDAFAASGHGGMRVLFLVPNLDLIVCWNDSRIEDHDKSPGNPATKMNQATRLIREAVLASSQTSREPSTKHAAPSVGDQPLASRSTGQRPPTILAVRGSQFTVNGTPTFLFGISYYGALGASEEFIRRDLDDAQRAGFNWIRIWATWSSFGNDVSVVDAEGRPREEFLSKLERIVHSCDDRAMLVDISLSRGNGVSGPPRLQNLEAHLRAVDSLVTALKPRRNWYLDLSNERNIRDKRFTSFDDLKVLRRRVRELDPDRLVTASHAGDLTREDVREYLEGVGVDFLTPHRPRDAGSANETVRLTKFYLDAAKELGRVAPLHYQEPFRRGFGKYEPLATDFINDARNAKENGAAGWCFHNGDTRAAADGRPRRSFDLRDKRLFDALDSEERKAVEGLRQVFGK